MEKKLHYRFDHKNKILHERLKGNISFNDFITYEKKILSDPEYDESYSIFSDIRDAVFVLSAVEVKMILKLMKDATSKNNIHQKCAFITNNPQDVVNSELIKISMQKFSPINIKSFSTKEAAYEWLNITESDKDIP